MTEDDKRRKRKRRELLSSSLDKTGSENEDGTKLQRRKRNRSSRGKRPSNNAAANEPMIDSPVSSPRPKDTTSCGSSQKLSNDVLWYLARTFLWQPDEIYRLARTSRSLWRTLEREIYLTDVFVARYNSTSVVVDKKNNHGNGNGVGEGRELGQGQGQGQGSSHDSDDDDKDNNGGGIRKPSPVRTTLLHWAAVAGRLDTLRKALGAARQLWPAYVDYQHGMCGHSALHFASHYGRLRVARELAATGPLCDVGAPSGWVCPAPQRLGAILERLVPGRFRVPPEYLLHSSRHPFRTDGLGLAILKGHAGVARWFARRGHYDARRAAAAGVVSALHLAALAGMPDIVAALLAQDDGRGGDGDDDDDDGGGGGGANFRCRHVEDSTPLMWAVAGRGGGTQRLETIRLLVSCGADPALRDNRRRTALDWAIGFKVPESVRWLLETFPEPEAPAAEGDRQQQQHWSPDRVETWTKRLQRCMADDCFLECTRLIVARYARRRLPETCLRLCAHSTFWDIDRSWDEPGCVSTASKNIETKRWLVEEGIGLGVLSRGCHQAEQLSAGGNATLSVSMNHASHMGDGWMQEELFLGRSFLHYAAGSNDIGPALLGQVLKRRAQDVNVADARGLTPLELALGYRCQPRKVQLLLRYGANPRLCFGGEKARQDIDRQIRELVSEDEEEEVDDEDEWRELVEEEERDEEDGVGQEAAVEVDILAAAGADDT